MAKRELCRAEIQEMIGYTIEAGSILRVKKKDELPIHLVVTKVSRGWIQGVKLQTKQEKLEGCVIALKKAKDVVYAIPTSYPQYVGVSKELIKGIRKSDCVGAEGYIVGRVLNNAVLKTILKVAKVKENDETEDEILDINNQVVFEEIVEKAGSKGELISELGLNKFKFLKKAVLAAISRKDGKMKSVLEELQKYYPTMKRSGIKKELNADLSVWISKSRVELKEPTTSYILQKVASKNYN